MHPFSLSHAVLLHIGPAIHRFIALYPLVVGVLRHCSALEYHAFRFDGLTLLSHFGLRNQENYSLESQKDI